MSTALVEEVEDGRRGGRAVIPSFALPQRSSRRRRKRSRADADDTLAVSLADKPEYKFEYLDHTADVQIHAWGATLREAFEHAGHAMYNYMVPLDDICVNDRVPELRVRVTGHDEQSLLYNFMQELLFDFHTEFRACCVLHIVSLDLKCFSLECVGRGDIFDRTRHASGTEIKAITYSAMDIKHEGKRATDAEHGEEEEGAAPATENGAEETNRRGADAAARDAHVYVIVDI